MIQIQNLKLQEQQIPAAEELILKIGDDPTNTSMLTIFRSMWDAGVKTEELKQAKNSIAQYLICEQMKNNHGWFELVRVWGDKTCRSCSGLGEKYKFEKAPEVQPCSCDEGFIWKPCTSCQVPDENGDLVSTGFFTKKNGTKVPCRNCTPSAEAYAMDTAYFDKHKGHRRTKCRKCLGLKVVQKLSNKRKLLPCIESTTPCEVCNGLGWIEPKKEKENHSSPKVVLFNPVLKALNETI